jgi:hypothetical protein
MRRARISLIMVAAGILHGCVTSASFSYSDGQNTAALTLHFRDTGKRVIPSK